MTQMLMQFHTLFNQSLIDMVSYDENGEMTDINVTLENGQPLDMNAKYSIVMNSYMSSVFDYEHEDEGESTFRTSNEMMLEFLSQHPDLDYGSVTRVKEL